jgi:hypothetical protein
MNKIGTNHHSGIPVIDVNPLVVGTEARHDAAAKMGQAANGGSFTSSDMGSMNIFSGGWRSLAEISSRKILGQSCK